ncbi:MAG: hypothetical protein K0S11_3 [Gammaproteobacteria bacterium]|jgi:hypothetical protein|nr:hypothetical protein [Gammaproteobacteria bacterium]
MYQRYSGLAAKYGLYAKGAEFIEGASRLVLPAEIALGGINVLQAESGTKLQTAFEETGRIVGGVAGGVIGGLVAFGEEGISAGILTPVAIATVVALTSAGAAFGKKFGHVMYVETKEAIDSFEKFEHEIRNKY